MNARLIKFAVVYMMLHFVSKSEAQQLPFFLKGTWRIESKVIYEHWDSLNVNSMKGFSYRLKYGHPQVKEYLGLTNVDAGLVYSATVRDQNDGKAITFKHMPNDSTWVFENLSHDFPKRITYKLVNNEEVEVELSDAKTRIFKYKMFRLDSED